MPISKRQKWSLAIYSGYKQVYDRNFMLKCQFFIKKPSEGKYRTKMIG